MKSFQWKITCYMMTVCSLPLLASGNPSDLNLLLRRPPLLERPFLTIPPLEGDTNLQDSPVVESEDGEEEGGMDDMVGALPGAEAPLPSVFDLKALSRLSPLIYESCLRSFSPQEQLEETLRINKVLLSELKDIQKALSKLKNATSLSDSTLHLNLPIKGKEFFRMNLYDFLEAFIDFYENHFYKPLENRTLLLSFSCEEMLELSRLVDKIILLKERLLSDGFLEEEGPLNLSPFMNEDLEEFKAQFLHLLKGLEVMFAKDNRLSLLLPYIKYSKKTVFLRLIIDWLDSKMIRTIEGNEK
jgi:hypothetical protein